jgi:hypothetical protein
VNSIDCPTGLVCERTQSLCVECVQPGDCGEGQLCAGNHCRAPCASDKDCTAAGELCELDAGHCVDCLSAIDCAEGQSCSDGVCRASAGGSGGAGGTGGGLAGAPGMAGASSGGTGGNTPGDPGTVVLLIDRSTSMEEDYAADDGLELTRWDAVKQAVLDAAGPLAMNTSGAQFGLFTYTAELMGMDAQCPLVEGVPPAADNFSAIETFFSAQELPQSKSETPTGAAVSAVAAQLSSAPSPKKLVLITDGEPDTCGLPDPQCGHDSTFDALQQAHAAGITTVVIGVGPGGESEGDWAKFLQDAANAGSGELVADPTEAHMAMCESIGMFEASYTMMGGSATFYRSPEMELGAALSAALGSP